MYSNNDQNNIPAIKVSTKDGSRTSDFRPLTSTFVPEHQFFHFLLVFLFILQIEHGTEYMVPDCGAYTKTLVFVLIMMKMMISPKPLHPLKRRVPGMNGIMHCAVHEITEKKAREKHKNILTTDQVHNPKNCRSKN